jgi:hypothetical protein
VLGRRADIFSSVVLRRMCATACSARRMCASHHPRARIIAARGTGLGVAGWRRFVCGDRFSVRASQFPLGRAHFDGSVGPADPACGHARAPRGAHLAKTSADPPCAGASPPGRSAASCLTGRQCSDFVQQSTGRKERRRHACPRDCHRRSPKSCLVQTETPLFIYTARIIAYCRGSVDGLVPSASEGPDHAGWRRTAHKHCHLWGGWCAGARAGGLAWGAPRAGLCCRYGQGGEAMQTMQSK